MCEITVSNIDFHSFFQDETIVKILTKIKPPLHDLNTLKFKIAFEIHTFKRHQVLGSHWNWQLFIVVFRFRVSDVKDIDFKSIFVPEKWIYKSGLKVGFFKRETILWIKSFKKREPERCQAPARRFEFLFSWQNRTFLPTENQRTLLRSQLASTFFDISQQLQKPAKIQMF